MSFLYAPAIALALGIVVPLLLHLRRRRTDRRVAFPALRYLSRAEDARARSLAASDVLLLAVRLGILLALALAAAGPLLGRGGARDHRPTDVALVIDNSASVTRSAYDAPLFDALLERARASLTFARAEDRFWIFPTVGRPLATGVGAVRALEALARIERTDGAADLGEAVARAGASLPREETREREVQLLSDLQRSAFGDDASGASDGAPLVAFVPPPLSEPNGALADIRVTGGTSVPSGVGHGVVLRTARFGGPPSNGGDGVGEADIRLQVDGRIVAAARAAWGSTATLGLPELPVGIHEIRAEIDPSGSRADDLRFYALRVVPPPVVAFDGPAGSFTDLGIETLTRAGRLGSGADPAVAVVESPAGPDATSAEAGTLVLLPPRDPVELPAFNQRLESLGVAWRARIDPGTGDLGLREPGAPFSLRSVRVRFRYALRPGPGGPAARDTVLLATEDGGPWLIRTEVDDRLVLLLASPLTVDATDLPAHPAMIPFLETLLIQWSHASGWPLTDFRAGTTVPLPAWAEEVTGPEGAVRRVEGGGLFTPARAGLYRVAGTSPAGESRVASFAANVPRIELDPTASDDPEELFPDRPVFLAGPDARSWEAGMYRSRRGRDAAPWLLGLALVLIAVEIILATPGRSRRSAAVESTRARSGATSRASS